MTEMYEIFNNSSIINFKQPMTCIKVIRYGSETNKYM